MDAGRNRDQSPATRTERKDAVRASSGHGVRNEGAGKREPRVDHLPNACMRVPMDMMYSAPPGMVAILPMAVFILAAILFRSSSYFLRRLSSSLFVGLPIFSSFFFNSSRCAINLSTLGLAASRDSLSLTV